jgi:cytidyltransferase-like protein
LKIICCAVAFNFFHEGHAVHLEEANKLGDKLIVIVANDKTLKDQKGGHNYPLDARLGISRIVKWLNPLNVAVVSIDEDNTVAETLRMIRPQIFAKGGDRTSSRMPQKEIDVCKEIGCEIVYGVGRQLNRSSSLKRIILGN